MKSNFDRSLVELFKDEGGFVNHPRDSAGSTNKGITFATFKRHIKRNGTVNDLKNMTVEQAGRVYKKNYWDKVHADDLPDGVDYAVFDFAVNSGPSRAVKFIQRIVGVPDDGKMGPITMAAIRSHSPLILIEKLCGNRLSWLHGLSNWDAFGRGWARRVSDVERNALEWATERPVVVGAPHVDPTPPTQPKNMLGAIISAISAIWRAIRRERTS